MTDYKIYLAELVKTVVNEGASDMHLSEGRHPTIRVSGMLLPLVKHAVLSKADTAGLLAELLTDKNKELFYSTKEVDFSYSLDSARFRGNAYFQQGAVFSEIATVDMKLLWVIVLAEGQEPQPDQLKMMI